MQVRFWLLIGSLPLVFLAQAKSQMCPTVDPDSVCNSNNKCPSSGVCVVVIAHTAPNGPATASVNGNSPSQYVCVKSPSSASGITPPLVQWVEGEYAGDFTVYFEANATPFTDDYMFQGYWTVGDWGTIQTDLAAGSCYKFTIGQQVGGSAYSADPKVIIQGMGSVPPVAQK